MSAKHTLGWACQKPNKTLFCRGLGWRSSPNINWLREREGLSGCREVFLFLWAELKGSLRSFLFFFLFVFSLFFLLCSLHSFLFCFFLPPPYLPGEGVFIGTRGSLDHPIVAQRPVFSAYFGHNGKPWEGRELCHGVGMWRREGGSWSTLQRRGKKLSSPACKTNPRKEDGTHYH